MDPSTIPSTGPTTSRIRYFPAASPTLMAISYGVPCGTLGLGLAHSNVTWCGNSTIVATVRIEATSANAVPAQRPATGAFSAPPRRAASTPATTGAASGTAMSTNTYGTPSGVSTMDSVPPNGVNAYTTTPAAAPTPAP